MSSQRPYNERLGQSPAEAIQEYYVRPRLLAAGREFPVDLMLLKAHAVMLAETGIVARDHVAVILRELLAIEAAGFEGLELRADLNDLYLNLQMRLMQSAGEEVGGWLHIALSRNDFDLTEVRIRCRDLLEEGIAGLHSVMRTLLHLASGHVETVMPGYTHHSQPAQPVTLGHFLLAHHDALARDVERLEQAYAVANHSAMGGCALATTGFPVDRSRVAEMIGCNGVVENSADATGSRDFLLQAGSAVAIAFSNLGRLTESLLLWNAPDSGMIELADQYCHISSIMPQKKNPVGLEIIRAAAVEVAGSVHAAFGVLKAVPLGNGREPTYVETLVFQGLEKLAILAPAMADMLATLTIHQDVMLSKAREGFSTMTELADEIVRQTDLSFHEAYVIVSRVAADVIGRGEKAASITPGLIDEVARVVRGRPLSLPTESVRRALDPVENVRVRCVTGGPAPEEVRRMLRNRRSGHDEIVARSRRRKEGLESAAAALDAAVRKVLGE
jgi:argininosuccinate lyase